MSEPDIVVLGGGIMGLGCAFELARSGAAVTLVESGELARKASWAAAGILVTRGATAPLSPFRRFYLQSIALYPAWLEALAAAGGRAVQLHRVPDYLVFDLGEERGRRAFETKKAQLDKERSEGFEISFRPPDFLQPHLAPGEQAFIRFREEAYLQNRLLLESLVAACESRGVRFRKGVAPRLRRSGAGMEVELGAERLRPQAVLVAAGAGSAALLEGLGLDLPLVPVKGQLLRLPSFHAEKAMVHFQEDLYLIPRDESLVVGATTEPGVWDEGFTAEGERTLRSRLARLFPRLAEEPSLEEWTGLRPRSRDRLPFMGAVEKGLLLCTGHYKTGISMAPLAARCMASLLAGTGIPAVTGGGAPAPMPGGNSSPDGGAAAGNPGGGAAVDLAPFDPWRPKGLGAVMDPRRAAPGRSDP